jgi:hypothetical protein
MQVCITRKGQEDASEIISIKYSIIQKKLVIFLYIFLKTDDIQKLSNYLLGIKSTMRTINE